MKEICKGLLIILWCSYFGNSFGQTLKEYTIKDANVKVKLPAWPTVNVDTTTEQIYATIDSTHVILVVDSQRLQTYILQVAHLNKYAYLANRDSLISSFLRQGFHKEQGDTMLLQRDVESNGIRWGEFIVGSNFQYNYKRVRIGVAGSMMIESGMQATYEQVTSTLADSFFNSVSPLMVDTGFNIYSDKLPMVVRDIQTNVDGYEKAVGALRSIPFTATHKILLHAALLHNTYPDDSMGKQSVRAELIPRLVDTDEDKGVAFIRDHYRDITKNAEQQLQVFAYLSRLEREDAYNLLFKLMKDSIPVSNDHSLYAGLVGNMDIINSNGDFIPWRMKYINMLPGFAKDPERPISSAVYTFIADLLGGGQLKPENINATQLFIDALQKIADQPLYYNLMDERNDARMATTLIDILSHYPVADQVEGLLNRWEKRRQLPATAFVIFTARIKFNLPVHKKAIKELAADLSYRKATYTLLVRAQLQRYYPKRYLRPRYWGQADLYEYLQMDNPAEIVQGMIQFVKTVDLNYHNIAGTVCVYKYAKLQHDTLTGVVSNSDWLFGISGLYQKGRVGVLPEANLTGANDQPFIEGLIMKYIKNMLEEEDGQ